MIRKLLTVAALFVAPVFADSVQTFNFNQNLGDIGLTDSIKAGAVQFIIAGFNVPFTPGDIWEKNTGPTEFGLGLAEQVDREVGITSNHFLQVDIGKLTADKQVESVSFGVNSIQAGESYDIWGSNVAGSLGTLIAGSQTAPTFVVPLAPYRYVSLTAATGDVLLNDVAVITTPEPSSVVLLTMGGALLAIALKLKRERTA